MLPPRASLQTSAQSLWPRLSEPDKPGEGAALPVTCTLSHPCVWPLSGPWLQAWAAWTGGWRKAGGGSACALRELGVLSRWWPPSVPICHHEGWWAGCGLDHSQESRFEWEIFQLGNVGS